MNLLEEIFGRLKRHRRVRSLVVMAFYCCVSINGFAQLIYLTDTRSVSGSASFGTNQYGTPPFYIASYSGYSGSASPSGPFADFQGSVIGSAILATGITNPNTGQVLPPITNTATIGANQSSFLHSQELYYQSGEFASPSSANGWVATGDSSLQVTFSVAAPVAYNLSVLGLGDPLGSSDSYNLSSANLGALMNGNTGTMLQANDYGIRLNYSGTFNPGDVYTLTLDSHGGAIGPAQFGDGGGLQVDLVVPEPSMTALEGLAFLIFLLRPRRMRKG
jgi:hypothetical protein